MKFLIIGGDLRQLHLGKILKGKGHEVSMFAFDKVKNPGLNVEKSQLSREDNDYIILPLPVTNGKGLLYCPLSARDYTIEEILDNIPKNLPIFYGKPNPKVKNLIKNQGRVALDYYEKEDYVELNGILTAEGAIEVLLREMDEALFESRVLILGNGRISKALAQRLKSFACKITISARNPKDFAQIRARGFRHIHTKNLGEFNYDIIINTIPAKVLENSDLDKIKKRTKLLELASAPYGFDMDYAKALGLNASLESGLPSKTSPRTAGKIIYETIINILKEDNE